MSQPTKRKSAAESFREQNRANFQAQEIFDEQLEPEPILQQAVPAMHDRAEDQSYANANEAADMLKTSEELQIEAGPVEVRITGLLNKRVIVPPNAHVVHTRLGRDEPVTIGLGKSFRYQPKTDAFLVVPAAMQTIGVLANCISKEKQGINILAYVQWQIDDFAVAYRKVDFSNKYDPLGVVNAQLREQAEAAIKDKIATMSVEEVLTDKEPVIEELTSRLTDLATGRDTHGDGGKDGIGIKIVTVQVKEAIVASPKLLANLQAPFQHEQEQAARLSKLQLEQRIADEQRQSEQRRRIAQAEAETTIARTEQEKETERQHIARIADQERFENAQAQEIKQRELLRQSLEATQKFEAAKASHEQELLKLQAERAAAEQASQLTLQAVQHEAQMAERRRELELDRLAGEIEMATTAGMSEAAVLSKLIDRLPEIASSLPNPDKLTINSNTSVADILKLLRAKAAA